jgi:hypothetical protein
MEQNMTIRTARAPFRKKGNPLRLNALRAMLAVALIGLHWGSAIAQVVGDFRSRQSGDWNADYTWEKWNGTSWIHENTIVTPGSVTLGGDGYPVVASTTSSAKTSATGTSHTVNLPSGIEAGDLLLVFWVDADVNSTVTIPAGWTELYNMVGTAQQRRVAIYRVANGAEGTSLTVTTSAAERSAHTAYRIAAGSYQGEPVAGTTVSSTSASPNPPSLTSGFGAEPTLWFAAAHSEGTSAAATLPTSYTSAVAGYTGTMGSAHARMTTGTRKLTAATEDPGTFALGASVVWGANTVAVQGIGSGSFPHPVMMARAFGAQSAADVTAHPITIPVGASGDLLVAVFSVDGNPTVSTTSSGWTKLAQASNGTNVTGAIFWKMASGSTSAADALSLTTTSAERSSHITYRIRGATGISGTAANGNSTNSNPPAHTAAEAAFLWIATRSGDDVTVATAAPSGYTFLETVPAGNAAGASTNAAFQVLGSASATQDPSNFTSATEQWVSYTLAILGPAPVVTYESIEPPTAASGDGFPSVAARATSAKTNNGNAVHVISLPSGIHEGDLLLIFYTDGDNSGADPALPAGYTLLYSDETGSRYRGAWYRIADGTEGATVSTTNSFGERSAHVVYRIAAGSYQGVPVASTVATGNGTTADPPNLSSGFGAVPTLWMAACHSAGTGTMTAPANYTANLLDSYTGATGDAHARTGASHRFTSNASENPAGFNLGGTSRQYAAVTIAVRGVPKTTSTVRNGHTVTVVDNESTDDLVVESGGTLTIHPGSLTVNGTSVTANGTVNGTEGTLILGGTSGNAITVSGSSTLNVFNVTAASPGGVTMNPNMNIRGTLQLNAGAFAAVGTARLVSDASGTGRLGPVAASASYSGNLRIERYVPAGATNWRLIGSPIQNRKVAHLQDDFITAGYPGSQYPNFPGGSQPLWPSIRWYNETNTGANVNDGLVGATSQNQDLVPGQGFAAWSGSGLNTTTAFTIDLENAPPVIAASPITLPMTFTSTGNPTVDGWNLVANPLPSPIAFDQISRGANVEDYVTYFDPATGNMATWDISLNAGTNGGTNTIQSMQGFYLKATGSAVTTTVSESAKVSGNSGGFFGGANGTPDFLRLRIASGINTFSDETVVVFTTGQPEFTGDDVPKFNFSHPQAPQIGTVSNGQVMAINAYGPFVNAIHIPVMVDVAVTGTYTVTATGLSQQGLTCLRLEDLLTGTTTVLDEGTAYSFSADASADAGTPRFMLHASAPLHVQTTATLCHGDATGGAEVELSEGQGNVTLYDAQGQAIGTFADAAGAVSINGLAAGDYEIAVEGYLGCAQLVGPFTIAEPAALQTEASTEQASCPAANDGHIALSVNGGTAPYSAAWSDGQTGLERPASAGVHSVQITDANGCTANAQVSVGAGIGPIAEAGALNPVVAVGETIAFVNNSLDANSFAWDFGDGSTSNAAAPEHAYDQPGIYTVTLTASNGPCASTSTITITVELSTGLAEAAQVPMRAWLSGDQLVVEHGFSDRLPLLLEVLSEGGQLWKQLRVAGQAGRMTVPAGDLASGIWYVRVSNSAQSRTLPVVVVR